MDLQVGADGGYSLALAEAAKRRIDVSGFAGKATWLKPIPPEMREFEERPTTRAARVAQGNE